MTWPAGCVARTQGLYLGFGKGVSAASGTELSPLWNKPDLGVTSYSEAFPPVAVGERAGGYLRHVCAQDITALVF